MKYEKALGTTFVNHFTDSDKFPLLVLGADRFSFKEVCALGVIQPRACRILSNIAQELKIKNTRQLYTETSPYTLAGMKGVGVTTLYVLLRVFETAGLDVDKWYARGQKEAIVTFFSLKDREQKAETRTREDERKRRRLRSRRQVTESEKQLATAASK